MNAAATTPKVTSFSVDGVAKTTTRNASLIVLAILDGKTVYSLTRDEETLKQTIYDIVRLGWTDHEVLPFLNGVHYHKNDSGVQVLVNEGPITEVVDTNDYPAEAEFVDVVEPVEDTRRVYNLDIVGGMYATDHSIHVHRAGCRDAIKAEGKGGVRWALQAHDVKDVVMDSFGPDAGSYFEEAGFTPGTPEYDTAWEQYVGEFKFFACVAKGLQTA